MEAILKFNLPEDEEDMNLALQGKDFFCVLNALDDYLRDLFKYKNLEVISIEQIRDKILELKQEYQIREYS